MVLINENEDIITLIRLNNTFAIRLWIDNLSNDIHQSDEHGFTLLHWAAWYGRFSLAEILLQRGVRANAVNRGDDTPLHLAASHNHLDLVELLIKHKSHINVANIHGNTPLHYACFHRYFSIAKCLIEAQGLLFISNRYGQTPIDLCLPEDMRRRLIDLAGQDTTVIPYDEHNRYSTNMASSFSKQSAIDINELQFNKCLFFNNRKEIWQAMYNNTMIMAKIFKLRENLYSFDIFQQEIEKIKLLNCSHLLLPFAVCHDTSNFIILTSYYNESQTLYQFLHESKSDLSNNRKLSLKLASDIGRGMAFLHRITDSFRPQFILNSHHVIIKAQSSCIEFEARINLADSHFSFESNLIIEQPAWMAPEVLQTGILTNASDIWSFAILLWELFTFRIPYSDLTPMECSSKIVDERVRLPATGVSPHIDKLIQLCTHDDPNKRPTFDAILPILEKIHF